MLPILTSVSLGFTFTANNTVSVTSLGYYDHGGDGFLTTSRARNLCREWPRRPPGPPLVSTTLAAGTSGTLGPNNFRYQAITPLATYCRPAIHHRGIQPENGGANGPLFIRWSIKYDGISASFRR